MFPLPPAAPCLALLLAATLTAAALDLEFVRVGQPRNFPDFTGQGRVDETFEIQRHEVTWTEYAAFLNAVAAEADPRGLWHPAMENAPTGGLIREGEPGRWRYQVKPGAERLPAVWLNWHDAARFCNWLHHGAQRGGETEHGAYELGGRNPREAARSERARCFLPSADEWHKAAYHEPDPARRGASPYWMFPTRSDLPPAAEAPPGGTNSARFGGDGVRTVPVGSYPATASAWGAQDLAGNVWEWIETGHRIRGGSAGNPPGTAAATHPGHDPGGDGAENATIGFRVARRPVAPVLEEAPASQAVRPGGTAIWRAVAAGEPPLTWRWRLGDEILPATGDVCRVNLPLDVERLGPLAVTVMNRHGQTASELFFLRRADLREGLALHFSGDAEELARPGSDIRRNGSGWRPVADRHGREGGAVAFDGRGGLRLPFTNQPAGATPRTLAAWVKAEDVPPPQPAFAHFGMGDWHGRVFGLGVNEQQPVFWGGSRDAASSLRVPSLAWHFLAVVYEPPWLTFWVNDASERVPAPELATVYSGGLWLGVDTVNDGVSFRGHFHGALDEVWIYSRALSADELAFLREAPGNPEDPAFRPAGGLPLPASPEMLGVLR